jgi:alanyl-tRNA synthetase
MEEGAMALFGEKYGDTVRMIKFGNHAELCGGTHVQNTNDIWQFKIKSEGAIAAGIRRIEAITGDAVKTYYQEQDNELSIIKKMLKNPTNLTKTIENLQNDNQKLRKDVDKLKKEKAQFIQVQLKNEFETIGEAKFLAKELDLDSGTVKDLLFAFGKELDNIIAVVAVKNGDKAIVSIYVSKSLVEKHGLHAGNMVREVAKEIQGGGGGQAFFATAGGKNPQGIDKALAKAKTLVVTALE